MLERVERADDEREALLQRCAVAGRSAEERAEVCADELGLSGPFAELGPQLGKHCWRRIHAYDIHDPRERAVASAGQSRSRARGWGLGARTCRRRADRTQRRHAAVGTRDRIETHRRSARECRVQGRARVDRASRPRRDGSFSLGFGSWATGQVVLSASCNVRWQGVSVRPVSTPLTVLAMARANAGEASGYAPSFRYGQRGTTVEIDAAVAGVATVLGREGARRVADVDLRWIGGSALTAEIAVPGRSGLPHRWAARHPRHLRSLPVTRSSSRSRSAWAEVLGVTIPSPA